MYTVFDLFSRSTEIASNRLNTVVPDVIQGTDTSEPQGVLASRLGVETRVYRAGMLCPQEDHTRTLTLTLLSAVFGHSISQAKSPRFLRLGVDECTVGLRHR